MATYPAWFQQLRIAYTSNAARMFILHFNVDDYVLSDAQSGNPVTRLVPFLESYARNTLSSGTSLFSTIFRYSHSLDIVSDGGVHPAGGPLERPGAANPAGVGAQPPAQAGNTLSHNLYIREEKGIADLRKPTKVLRVLERILRSTAQRSLVIIEHVETLAPRDAPDADQLINSEILKRWATDDTLRRSDNLGVLITPDLNLIDPGIYAPGTNCFPIQINLPGTGEREALLRAMEAEAKEERIYGGMRRNSLISGLAQIDPQLQKTLERGTYMASSAEPVHILAEVSQGFRLVEIDQLNRQVRAEYAIAQQVAGDRSPQASGEIIRLDDIKRQKRRVISEQSNGLLENLDVERGFDAIGGMAIVKKYLETLSGRILASRADPVSSPLRQLIPRGIILAGPPGTGKTIIAEALALESKLNMVKLRNVREAWVGQSERNLTRAFDIIKALSPILVFVDEIDQAFGSRSLGQSADGGTSERIFGQILEFLGDDRQRGNVIWVAATNRPDVLDAAMLRRFDRIIPCLLPTLEEQLQILAALPRSIKTLQYDSSLAAMIACQAPALTQLFQDRSGFVPTGAVIETICQRAAEWAGDHSHHRGGISHVTLADIRLAVEDYRSNANAIMYDYQSLLAIQACNFYSVMPELPNRPPFFEIIEPRSIPLTDASGEGTSVPAFWRTNQIAQAKLAEQIRQHRAQLGLARRMEGA
ncbi:MAG: ATP-binding protein [Chloroflexales bacterium]